MTMANKRFVTESKPTLAMEGNANKEKTTDFSEKLKGKTGRILCHLYTKLKLKRWLTNIRERDRVSDMK